MMRPQSMLHMAIFDNFEERVYVATVYKIGRHAENILGDWQGRNVSLTVMRNVSLTMRRIMFQ